MVLGLGLLLLGGCGDDAEPSSADGAVDQGARDASSAGEGGADLRSPLDGGATTMTELCARQAALLCAHAQSCCASALPAAADAAACRKKVEAVCIGQAGKEAAALQAGTARIVPGSLSRCEAFGAAAAASCRLPSLPEEQAACRGVVVAKASVGEVCSANLSGAQCADGAGVCFAQPTGTVCKAWGRAKEPCAQAPCAPGLLCIADPSGGASICDERRGEGKPCPADAYCQEGLVCKAKVCRPALAKDEACSKSGQCAPSLACDPFSETCVERKASGAACYQDRHCAAGLACHGLSTGMVCMFGDPSDGGDDPSLPGLGEPCSGGCKKGLSCREGPLPGACVPALCVAIVTPDAD